MPNVLLSTKAAGDIVTLKVSGSPRNFIVVQQGRPASGNYDASFNNVTWLLMQDIYDQRQWANSRNGYANSSIHSWLNNEASGFLSLLDADIRAVIPTVKIPYRPGDTGFDVSSGANGLACKAFLLSMLEVGLRNSYSPEEGTTLTYFTSGSNARRIAKHNGSPASWWTRSPFISMPNYTWNVGSDGAADYSTVIYTYGCRPALPLPSNLYVSDDGSILTNEPPTAPGSIDVTGVVSGRRATITLTAATDPDGTVASYRYERKVDGGGWQQFADVNSLSVTDSINDRWTTVTYRACAVDNEGAQGPFATSQPYTVMDNQPPTAPGSITVTGVVGGGSATITLTAATDPDGTVASYRYERKVDGGGWQQFADVNSLSVTDSINDRWTTVTYRACAVDNEGAQGPFATSQPYIVMHNQPPTAPGSINATNVVGGQTATITITAATDPDGAVESYVYERSVDDSAHWDVIATTSALSTTDHISSEWGTVAYRAKAVDDDGASGPYVTSKRYDVPAWGGSDIAGGKSGRFEDHLGNKLLPRTLAQDCLGPDGKDVATWIAELSQGGGSAAPLEPVVKAAPPSGSFALAPGTLYDFTQADATALTFTFEAPADGKAAAYHVMFRCGSTAATVTLPEGVKTPDGYVIEAGRVYELSILEGLLTYQSWEADA